MVSGQGIFDRGVGVPSPVLGSWVEKLLNRADTEEPRLKGRGKLFISPVRAFYCNLPALFWVRKRFFRYPLSLSLVLRRLVVIRQDFFS
jgi:hypothetical protein